MRKFLLFIVFFMIALTGFSQKVTVGVKRNVIYAYMENPLDIAVEGYTNDQLTINARGCKLRLDTGKKQYYLTAQHQEPCEVLVSYRKGNVMIIDTIKFETVRIESPISKFGNLLSQSYRIEELMSQNEINGATPNLLLEDSKFTVTSYACLYVAGKENTCAFAGVSRKIPLELKYKIMNSKSGDKILFDDIQAVGPRGIKKRLAPISLSVYNSFEREKDFPDFYINELSHEDSVAENDRYYYSDCDEPHFLKPFVRKGYKVYCGDTALISEAKIGRDKVFWKKLYYASGKLQSEYNFEKNDSTGWAITYYEDGKIRSKGNVIASLPNIFHAYREDVNYYSYKINDRASYNYDAYALPDSFFIHDFVPTGHWLCYSENGKVLMDCNLALYDHGKIPMQENDGEFDMSHFNISRRKSSVKEAKANKDHYFKVAFDGLFKTYNYQGQLIEEKICNYKVGDSKLYVKYYPMGDVTHNKITLLKEYYSNGNLKELCDFSKNDTIGVFQSYYEAGQLKSEGNIILKRFNIRNDNLYPDSVLFRDSFIMKGFSVLDTFVTKRFAPINNWKGYHRNGKLALDCNFKILGWDYLPGEKSYDDYHGVYLEHIKMKSYSISDALKYTGNRFYSRISGPCKLYDTEGQLIKEIDFKN